MNERNITADGKSPLTHFIENLLIELEGIQDAAAYGVFHEEGVDSLASLVDKYGGCHREWYRRARQELIDGGSPLAERERLEKCLAAQDAILQAAIAYDNDDVDRASLDQAFGVAYEALQGIMPLAKPLADGPCGINQWRHNGVLVVAKMQPAAWLLCKYLWEKPDRSATFDELKQPVYSDPEHIADANAFGALRRAANDYFSRHGAPWRVTIRKTSVSMTAPI